MAKKVIPYKESNLGKKEQVTQMFDKVSSNYDFLNRLLTFGIDVSWRKKVVKMVADQKAKMVLDIATGTGDLAIMLAKINPDKVIGLDISPGMLKIGKKKVKQLNLADKIEMDVSTISRVANSKYVDTPYGTKLIKYFFSESMKNSDGDDVSTKQIKKILETIIINEDKKSL